MSVVERFKKRKQVSPIIDVKIGDVVLQIARISKMELEKASRLANKELQEEGLDKANVDAGVSIVARMANIATVLKDHVKGWNLEGEPFTKDSLNAFFSELSYEERTELGMNYFITCEADEKQKKILENYLNLLKKPSESDSTMPLDNPTSSVESVSSTSETSDSTNPLVGPDHVDSQN